MTAPVLVCDKCQMVILWQDWAALGPQLCDICLRCWTLMRKGNEEDTRGLWGRNHSSIPAMPDIPIPPLTKEPA